MTFWAGLGIVIVSALLLWLGIPATETSAHANQVRSNPAPGTTLEQSPDRVVVWFSEPISEEFSSIRVLDPAGNQVDNGGSQLDPTEPTAMVLPLPPLENGAYVVAWNNLSQVDGHRVFGSFSFGVGEGTDPDLASLPETPLLQSPADPWIRWLFYIGAALSAGVMLFQVFTLAPAANIHRENGTPTSNIKVSSLTFQTLGRVAFWLIVIGLTLALVAQVGALIQQAAISQGEGELAGIIELAIRVAGGTSWGMFWLFQSGAIVVTGILAISAYYRSRAYTPHTFLTETPLGLAALAGSIAVLLISSMTSHNAASPEEARTPAIVTDLIHFIAAAGWVGGLSALVAGIAVVRASKMKSEASNALAIIVPKFTPLATVSAVALVISGSVSTWLQVQVIEAFATPYGRVLIVKIALVFLFISFAALNSFFISKHLPKSGPTLFRFAIAEVVIAAVILITVGWLTGLEPARQYAGRQGIGIPDGVTYFSEDKGVILDLDITPGQVGANTINVTLTDRDGDPFREVLDTRIKIGSLEQDLGEGSFSLLQEVPGVWSSQDYIIPLAGAHQADITVLRREAADSIFSFRFEALATGVYGDPISPDGNLAWTLLGIELAAIAVFMLIFSFGRAEFPKSTMWRGSVAALLIIGILTTANTFTIRAGLASNVANPIPKTSESVSAGAVSYGTYCSRCHGQTGLGDGPERDIVPVPPADLTIHIPLHRDVDLFTFITDGIPESGMPAHRDILEEKEIWDLVNFVRTFPEK